MELIIVHRRDDLRDLDDLMVIGRRIFADECAPTTSAGLRQSTTVRVTRSAGTSGRVNLA